VPTVVKVLMVVVSLILLVYLEGEFVFRFIDGGFIHRTVVYGRVAMVTCCIVIVSVIGYWYYEKEK